MLDGYRPALSVCILEHPLVLFFASSIEADLHDRPIPHSFSAVSPNIYFNTCA